MIVLVKNSSLARLICLGLILISIVGLIVASAADEKSSNESAREALKSQRLFDFSKFRSQFKKSYGSLTEELAREKLFLSRAFKAFLSLVGYKNYKSSSYLRVNELSDRTEDELNELHYDRPSLRQPDKLIEPKDIKKPETDADELEEALDKEELEKKLNEIVSEHKDEPGYVEMLSELERSSNKERKKRDTSGNNKRDSLSVDSLFETNSGEEFTSSKLVRRVQSNNPDYEVPELDSFGDEDDQVPIPMNPAKSVLISGMKGAEWLGGLLANTVGLFGTQEKKPKSDIPDKVYVDHRQSECLTPIKNQKFCGSCYIFSTMALYEWQHCKETGQLVEFSEQYPLDCGARIGMQGCDGGFEVIVSQFVWLYGVELSKSYPYRYRVDSCPYTKNLSYRKMGYLKVKEHKMKDTYLFELQDILMEKPVLMGFGVPRDFHHYGGGVDMGLTCDPKRGHSMLIIGSGIEDGLEYWLIRNSYGTSWGEKGHYKLAKSASKRCFLDGGTGLAISSKTNVFGEVNAYNDGSAVRDHVDRHKFSVSNLITNLISGFTGGDSDPNIVTPPSG